MTPALPSLRAGDATSTLGVFKVLEGSVATFFSHSRLQYIHNLTLSETLLLRSRLITVKVSLHDILIAITLRAVVEGTERVVSW